MTDLFEKRVEAFQMFLSFPRPYATSILAFMDEVIHRLERGLPLADQQSKLLLTQDKAEIRVVLTEFAKLVDQSAIRLQMLLEQGDIPTAYGHCRGWPNNYWRYYEGVLNMFEFEGNSLLQEPSEVSEKAMTKLKNAFPVNLNAADVLEGGDVHFQQQLVQKGNPWKA